MSDEVSLFALMDSHLSRTRLDDGNDSAHSSSDMVYSLGPRLVIPNFFPGNSPMKDFLTEQISNTLKAKEKRKQEEEQQKLEEEMKSLKNREKEQLKAVESMAKMKLHDEKEYIIDLTPAIIQQPKPNQIKAQPLVSNKTSTKAQRSKLGVGKFLPDLPLYWNKETCLYKPWDPHLMCLTDISYILKQKIKKGKCSSFGKVLCSRVRPVRHVGIPHEVEKYDFNIAGFDFKTKSPGDIYRKNQRKPKISTRWTVDILDYI